MALLPSDVPTRLVTATMYFVNEDSVDPDTKPEYTVVTGSVVFTASPKTLRMPTKPAILVPLTFEGVFNSEGQLIPKDGTGVGMELIVTNSPLLNPTDWTWTCTFNLKVAGTRNTVNIDSFSFQLPAGTEPLDLVSLMPVSASGGVLTIQGPPGEAGDVASVGLIDAAREAAISDATTKYGGLPSLVDLMKNGRHLDVDEHLDTVLTPGSYYVDADTEARLDLGFPVARAGRLQVDRFRPSNASLVAVYYPFRHPGFFVRYFYQSVPYTGAPYGTVNNGWVEYRTWDEVQSAIASALPAARSSTTSIACIGDSLTAGYSSGAAWDEADTYPAKLGAYLGAGVTVTKRGFTGSTTDQINLRVGALPLEMKIPGGTIPASGSVTLTSKQVIGGWGGTVSFNAYGYLEGVYGLLQYTEAGGYTFTRSGSGAAVTASRATFLGEFKQHTTDTIIYGAGRNDITKNTTGMEATVADHVIRGYTEIMAYATPRRKQVVLLGTITRTDEAPGSAGFEAVQEIATRARALWPANFADLQGYLTGSKVWTDTGITPTQADLDAQALGKTPPSLFDDETHYNRATAAAIAVNLIGPYLEQKGYV